MFIIFSLFINLTSAQVVDLKPQIDVLIFGEGDQKKARTTLQAIKDLDARLMKAIEMGGSEEFLALELIKHLHRESLVDFLIKKLQGQDSESHTFKERFVALATLSDGNKGDQIINELQKSLPLVSTKSPADMRIILLTVMARKGKFPPASQMLNLLDDRSYELRMKVMEIAEKNILKNPKEYLALLHRALKISPYPVRLKASQYISVLPLSFRKEFAKEILNCTKNDENEMVKNSCRSVKF